MNGVILSESAVMLHAIGVILSPTAILQALIRIVLRQAAVRFERAGVSLRTIGILCRKTAVSHSVLLVSRKVIPVRNMAASYRFVLPSEPTWRAAFRAAAQSLNTQ